MNKSLLAIAATIFALGTMFASAAEAGKLRLGLGFGGPVPFHGHYSNNHRRNEYRKPVRRKVQRRAVRKHYAAKKKAPAPVETASYEMENSSIATAKTNVAKADEVETVETVETAAIDRSDKLGCKKFFPSVGMTLTVPCE